jgi:hypothetical protein
MKFTEFDAPEFGEYMSRKIVLSKDDKPIRFQIPKLYMPFGISGFTPDYGQKKWNVDFSIKNWDQEGSYNQRFLRFLVNLENQVIDHVHANCAKIFNGTAMSRDAIVRMFNSNLKFSDGRDPRFRVKVDTDSDGHIKPVIFDANEDNITTTAEEKLHSHKMGAAIVELNSVYFMNKMFGMTWKLHQLKVFEPQAKTATKQPTGFLFSELHSGAEQQTG